MTGLLGGDRLPDLGRNGFHRVRLRLPFARLGVPTQTIDTSLLRIASSTLDVALILPLLTPLAMSSSRPDSTTGASPALKLCTFEALVSTPIMSWPLRAKQAAETAPT